MMFAKTKLNPDNAEEFAQFLNWMRDQHWSLSSQGYRTKPSHVEPITARDLLRDEGRPNRVGTFILKCDGAVIASVRVDERHDDGRIAIMSAAETAPLFQRRGTFWRQLGLPVIRVLCSGTFDRIEALTWPFNRKGIPVYKRFGFRAVPDSSLLMENYLPLIARHPDLCSYFSETDLLRALTTTRSYGYDDVTCGGMSAFVYEWSGPAGLLRVLVDWRQHRISTIDKDHRPAVP